MALVLWAVALVPLEVALVLLAVALVPLEVLWAVAPKDLLLESLPAAQKHMMPNHSEKQPGFVAAGTESQ